MLVPHHLQPNVLVFNRFVNYFYLVAGLDIRRNIAYLAASYRWRHRKSSYNGYRHYEESAHRRAPRPQNHTRQILTRLHRKSARTISTSPFIADRIKAVSAARSPGESLVSGCAQEPRVREPAIKFIRQKREHKRRPEWASNNDVALAP